MATPQANYFQREKGAIIDQLGGKCVECGSEEYLEIHHIKQHGKSYRAGSERIRDWKLQLKRHNLLVLCYKCHKKVTFPKRLEDFELVPKHLHGQRVTSAEQEYDKESTNG